MGRLRRLAPLLILVWATDCKAPQHLPPTAPNPPVAQTPTRLSLALSPPELPVGGGTVVLRVEATAVNGSPAPQARVAISASDGTLQADHVMTDETGHGRVEWAVKTNATVRASVGDLVAEATIKVQTPPTTPPSPSPPAPTPPVPAPPDPSPPTPGSPGLRVTFFAVSPPVRANVPAQFHFSVNPAGTAIKAVAWDFNADNAIDSESALPRWTFSEVGRAHISVTVTSAAGEIARDAGGIDVLPGQPPLALSLTALPPTAPQGSPIDFTANVTNPAPGETITEYVWDFGDGTTDETPANTARHTYTVVKVHIARVTITTNLERTLSTTTPVDVTKLPDLTVALAVTPAQPPGPRMLTATVTSGSVPASMAFDWDVNNDGTIDTTTTSASPASITHIYTPTGTYTAKVTVRCPDGRTASGTVSVVVN